MGASPVRCVPCRCPDPGPQTDRSAQHTTHPHTTDSRISRHSQNTPSQVYGRKACLERFYNTPPSHTGVLSTSPTYRGQERLRDLKEGIKDLAALATPALLAPLHTRQEVIAHIVQRHIPS